MSSTSLFPAEEAFAELFELLESENREGLKRRLAENPHLVAGWQREIARLQRFGLLGGTGPSLGPEYRVLGKLGKGGMGVVYLAEQISSGRKVAVKTIRPSLLRDPRVRERFRREALTISKLSHEGIVPMIEFHEEGELPFYAMKWIDGLTLASVLEAMQESSPQSLCGRDMQEKIGKLVLGESQAKTETRTYATFQGSWEDACIRLVWQTAEALQYAHARGVVHRDVKPSNILLTPDGQSMLLDFGLATLQGGARLTSSGSQAGTLPYLPPELLDGSVKAIDEKADIYALGVTLYELLTLRLPFHAAQPGKTVQLIVEGQPKPPRKHNPALSPQIEAVCLRAMARDPRRRYANVHEFVAELAKVMDGQNIETPSLWLSRFRADLARRPLRYWPLFALLAFLLGLGWR